MPVYFRVSGELDTAALGLPSTTCLPATPACVHASSRTRRAGGAGDPAPRPFKLQIEDVSAEPAAEREAYVARRVREEIGRPSP